MPIRLVATALTTLTLLAAACASGESAPPRAAPQRGASSAVDTATGDDASAVPAAAKVKTKTSGCNSNGSYEICFSSPGSKGGSDPAVVRHFIDIFNAAGPGDSLRIAMFRWDIPSTTKALVAAQKRGAHVEIVADADMTTKPAGRSVIAQIEAGDPMPHNVVVCNGSCLPWAGTGPAPPSQNV